jgi:hypothetical protein
MKYGVVSKLSLLSLPIAVGISSKLSNIDLDTIMFSSMNILALSELYSIIGNVYTTRTKQELPEWDIVSIIGGKIKTYLTLKAN